MAFYFFVGANAPFPLYFPPNLNFHSSFNSPPSFHSIEHFSQLPSVSALAPPTELKNERELPTITPEDPPRSSADLSRNRRKREKNLERELISAKKNSESNIINHFFTFFTAKEASLQLVSRAFLTLGKNGLDIEKCLTLFYNVMRTVNLRRGRKYINKAILWSYFSEENLEAFIQKNQNIEELATKDLSLVMRKCLYNFIRQASLTSILTSKRISRLSKEIHLSKRRKISKFITSPNQRLN